ncbi:MAG: alpha/beta hydrolase [Alphaproteobacteria bacterium]
MIVAPSLSGPVRPPASGRAARELVVLLHGWGADGNDLIGLAPDWARQLPDAFFAAPHGPDACEQNPMGRQWFSFADARAGALASGAARVARLIDRFVDSELARLGLEDDRLALVGFSQGAMMALYVGLRRPRPCAAVLGYGAALVGGEGLKGDLRSRPPILLVHGDADEIVPVVSLYQTVEALGALEVPVQWHVSPGLGHGIDPEGLIIGRTFLAACLSG